MRMISTPPSPDKDKRKKGNSLYAIKGGFKKTDEILRGQTRLTNFILRPKTLATVKEPLARVNIADIQDPLHGSQKSGVQSVVFDHIPFKDDQFISNVSVPQIKPTGDVMTTLTSTDDCHDNFDTS